MVVTSSGHEHSPAIDEEFQAGKPARDAHRLCQDTAKNEFRVPADGAT